ncbi:LPS assembly protein LptD [Tahibacter amnicola]|uniref:LPS-assembly protein LptD n=1 Tax=Tahibacter amnicola TaxID=2976241 RepID=A0ABY6BDX0_9GAMM|nr:LPS assembly protein LptD [Tahibacter amnicola]UXI67438.1 LPS assembly protein LptD [Tahibacter amnicola]
MPRNAPRFPAVRLLALATIASLHGTGAFAATPKADDFRLCKPNALLSFYTPGLPTTGDRNAEAADFTADRFQSKDTSKYVLEGKARIQRLDQLLQAERLTYWTETTAWLAEGDVRYQDRGLLLSATRGEGTTTPSTATLDNVRFQLLGSRGNGSAAQAKLIDADHASMTQVGFTTCDPEATQWEIRADDLSLDQAEGVGRGHNATLRLGDVPILWLPYVRFPIDERRQSGFLYPRVGFNGNSGFDYTQPYYINIAPNYDATLYPRIVTQRGLMLGGEFRYLTDNHRGQIDGSWMPDDRKADRDRGDFHIEHHGVLSPHWNIAANINHVSDDRYFEDFGDSLSTVSTSLLPSSAYLLGHGAHWTASFGGDRYQITDPTLNDIFEPYRRLPRATFEADVGLVGSLRGGVKSEFVSFSKECQKFAPGETGVCPATGERLDLYPYLSLPLEGASWFLRPEVGVRHTRYEVEQDSRVGPSGGPVVAYEHQWSPRRTLPISSVDAGLFFERETQLWGTQYTQTLEPRLYYLNVPYRDQSDIPLFDTQPVSFDYPQLFTTNRFTGADRQMDAKNLTVALTTRLLESNGAERLSASFGQIRYFDDQRVQLPGVNATDFSSSAYVGELDLRISDRWRLKLADHWDPNKDRTDLSAVSVQHRFLGDGVVNLSYRYRRDFLEQTDLSALVPINEVWRLIGRWNYSLRDEKTLEGLFGIEHDSCCVAWRLLARRYVRTAEGKANNALYFELEFKGIGAIGQKTEDFLRRGILGYQ